MGATMFNVGVLAGAGTVNLVLYFWGMQVALGFVGGIVFTCLWSLFLPYIEKQ